MADRAGSIAYRIRGRLAVRAAANGWTAVVAATIRLTTGPASSTTRTSPAGATPSVASWSPPTTACRPTGPYVSHDWAHPARAPPPAPTAVGRSDRWDCRLRRRAARRHALRGGGGLRPRGSLALTPDLRLERRARALLRRLGPPHGRRRRRPPPSTASPAGRAGPRSLSPRSRPHPTTGARRRRGTVAAPDARASPTRAWRSWIDDPDARRRRPAWPPRSASRSTSLAADAGK